MEQVQSGFDGLCPGCECSRWRLTVFCAERQPDQKRTFCKLITPRRSQHAFLPKASSVGKHTQTQQSLAEPPNCRPLLLSSYFCFPECMSTAYFCNVQLSSKKDQWAQFLLLQMLTPGWDFHRVRPSAQSTNKHCLTTKTFSCHRENTATSYTVFIQDIFMQHLSLFPQKEVLVGTWSHWFQ